MSQLSLQPFPNSLIEPFIETSPQTPRYNCIAWAYGTDQVRLWPGNPYYMWPDGIPTYNTIDSFIKLFASIGYIECENGDLVEGVEKIAIYEYGGIPTHAAKQLENGLWSSKLGDAWDVSHSLNSIRDGYYGKEVVFMSRNRE